MSHPKITSTSNIRNAFKVNSQNSLMATLDKKRQERSKDKDKYKLHKVGQSLWTYSKMEIRFNPKELHLSTFAISKTLRSQAKKVLNTKLNPNHH